MMNVACPRAPGPRPPTLARLEADVSSTLNHPTPTTQDAATGTRVPNRRRYLMCRPDRFTVSYRINPWMNPDDPTDTSLAVSQWEQLHQTYLDLGPASTSSIRSTACRTWFRSERRLHARRHRLRGEVHLPGAHPEGPAYMDWFAANGFRRRRAPFEVTKAKATSCSSKTPSSPAPASAQTPTATTKCADLSTRGRLAQPHNPSFYHLDTAIAVLDPVPPTHREHRLPAQRL